VAAAEVLDERVPGGQDPRGPVAFQAAHRPQPRLQPAMVGLDGVVRVALDGMQRRRNQLARDPLIGRGLVGGDLGRDGAAAQRPGEEPPGRGQVRRADSSTSMTWPCWSACGVPQLVQRT